MGDLEELVLTWIHATTFLVTVMLSMLKVMFSSMVPLVTLLKTQSVKLIVTLLLISIPLVTDLSSHLTSDVLVLVIDHPLIASPVLTNLLLVPQLMVVHV